MKKIVVAALLASFIVPFIVSASHDDDRRDRQDRLDRLERQDRPR